MRILFRSPLRMFGCFLSVLGLLCVAAAIVYLKLFELGTALEAHSYKDYVMLEYMPAQRRLTGKWPTDLRGFPGFVDDQLAKHTAPEEKLKRDLEFHFRNYKGLEMQQVDKDECKFTLLLQRGSLKCESSKNDRIYIE